jgi:rRNA methylases
MEVFETVCPNLNCGKELKIEVPDSVPLSDKRGHHHGQCPLCGQVAAFRSTEARAIIEREFEKKVRLGHLKGGPERSADFVADLSVLVEDVRSLWNVGSIFRSSDGSGFQHIYLSGISGSPPRKEIEKVSLGAEQNISWEYHMNPLAAIQDLRVKGIQIVGLEKTKDSALLTDALEQNKIKTPMCLIVGNEVSGLSPQLLDVCELVCHLPMRGMKESLNVAVAFGIAAYLIAECCQKHLD